MSLLTLDHDNRNPGGVRFGSAEIYEVIDLFFSDPTGEFVIIDYLAVGQSIDHGSDERVVLFVKLPDGRLLSPKLEQQIKTEIRTRRSPRHVPSKVRNCLVCACTVSLIVL